MNEDIIKQICNELSLKQENVKTVLKLLEEGNTIPFIARYRKEVTGAMDEEEIRGVNEYYLYQVNLLKRKEDVIRLIDEKQMLTEEIKQSIMACNKLVDVEDIYRPYKEKKKTKATEAIKNGLEPLAKAILADSKDVLLMAGDFINENVKTVAEALEGAKYIIAEMISDNANFRKYIREYLLNRSTISSTKKKNSEDENKVYEMYYEYSEALRSIKPHRILALNRGETEKVLNVSIDDLNPTILDYLERKLLTQRKEENIKLVKESIADSYKRLIFPSIEREIRTILTDEAHNVAIDNFSSNLASLLMTPPMKDKVVMGYDPAFRTGCKLAIIDATGQVLNISVIYPTEPHNKIAESEQIVLDLIAKYNVDLIAIGNGTASRESEKFIADTIKKAKRKVEYIIVSEAGASVYSASKLAIEEFPDLTVEKRSAVSIGRRVQDALSELVKIDPQSIGVGLYQHDIAGKKLDESLEFVVSKIVNQVGVNANTASKAILKYISGMNKKAIDSFINYRNVHGKIKNREEIKKIPGITAKIYEQAIGFIRVIDGDNPLDRTSIHPESYKLANCILEDNALSKENIGTADLNNKLDAYDILEASKKYQTDIYTIQDIIANFKKPIIDPRDSMPQPLLKSDILHLEDLKVGTTLQGTVRNVVDFGAFIDIGLKNDGLVHISKISNNYIKHPSEVLSVGDIVTCHVIDVDLDKKKVSLSLID